MKLWYVHWLSTHLRAKAEAAGQDFDFKRDMAPYARQIDDEVGGQNANRYAWLTPTWRRNLNLGMFSWNWTLSAWNAAGMGLFSSGILKNYTTPEASKFIFFRRWPQMMLYVLFLAPLMVQAAAFLLGAPPPDDDDDEGDEDKDHFFMFNNEKGRKLHADITPLMRWSPLYKGAPTGERRQYIRWGKQAYEVFRELEKPWQSLMGKLSQVGRYGVEMATGYSAGSSEWEMPFKDMGLAGLLVDRDGDFGGSRLGFTLQKFVPFSVLAAVRQPDAAPLQFFGPTSKGMSFYAATKQYEELLRGWAHKDSFGAIHKNRKVKAQLEALGPDILDAAAANGYDPKKVLESARGAVLKDSYAKLYRALNDNDMRGVEEASREIARLNGTVQTTRASIKNRNSMYGDAAKLTPEQKAAIDEAFRKP